jgi:sodium-dependent dicarboxylate transporter 2/3/5
VIETGRRARLGAQARLDQQLQQRHSARAERETCAIFPKYLETQKIAVEPQRTPGIGHGQCGRAKGRGGTPNLIGIAFIEEETNVRITFFSWVLTAAPIVLLMFIALCTILILLNRPEVRSLSGAEEYVAAERSSLGPFSRGERNTLIVFLVAVTLWVLPGLTALIFGDESTIYSVLYSRLDEGTVAIVAAALLFLLPLDWSERRFTMNWNEASRIDWGTIILFGCGIALGTLLSDTGLAEIIGNSIANTFGFTSLAAVAAVSALIAIIISETTSNTASATIVVPIVIPIANAAGLDPLVPALAAVFGASFGFMMPVSTPQNAVVYGSGMIPITKMVRSGLVFDIIGLILIVLLIPVMAGLILA